MVASAFLLGVIAAGPVSAGEPPVPFSTPRLPDSLVVVALENDVQHIVARVEPYGSDYIRLVRHDGSSLFLPVYLVVSIREWHGRDRTRDVLEKLATVGDSSMAEVPTIPRGFAFTGKPLPETRWFLITHAGLAARVDAGSSLYKRSSAYILVDFGAMRNVGKRWAVGANLYVGADDYRSRVGPKARIRYWLGREVAAEAAAGVLVTGEDEWRGSAVFPGYVAEVNLGHNETLLLTGAVETIDIEKSGTRERDKSWYLGAKMGSVPGAILSAVGLVALGAILSADSPSLW